MDASTLATYPKFGLLFNTTKTAIPEHSKNEEKSVFSGAKSFSPFNSMIQGSKRMILAES